MLPVLLLSLITACGLQASPAETPGAEEDNTAATPPVESASPEPTLPSDEPIYVSPEIPEDNITPTPSTTDNPNNSEFLTAGLYKLENNIQYNLDLDNDGTLDEVMVVEISGESTTYLRVNDERFIPQEMYGSATVILRENGTAALLFETGSDGDYTTTYICVYGNDGLTERAQIGIDDAHITNLTLYSFTLDGLVFYLGNQHIRTNVRISEDFSVTSDDYAVVTHPSLYTAKIDLTLGKQDGENYVDSPFPAGTQFSILSINIAADCSIIETTDGTRWRLTNDRYDNEFSAFDGVYYAGV
jgi:hypothetical protein